MMARWCKTGIVVLALFCTLAAGCRKNYEMVVVNDTPFSLLEVKVEDHSLAIPPRGASEAFKMKLPECRICFTAQGVSIHVAKFADSTRSHEHASLNWIALKEFSSSKTNSLIVRVDSSFSGGIQKVFDTELVK